MKVAVQVGAPAAESTTAGSAPEYSLPSTKAPPSAAPTAALEQTDDMKAKLSRARTASKASRMKARAVAARAAQEAYGSQRPEAVFRDNIPPQGPDAAAAPITQPASAPADEDQDMKI